MGRPSIARKALILAPLAIVTLCSSASATTYAVHNAYLFAVGQWTFVCDVDSQELRNCSASKDFNDIKVRLDRVNAGIQVSVDGGCKESGSGSVDVVRENPDSERYELNVRLIIRAVIDGVDARRSACNMKQMSKADQTDVEYMSLLYNSLRN